MGLLVVDVAGHGGLRLGAGARNVLRGDREVRLRKDTVRKKTAAAKVRSQAALEDPDDQALFQTLRAKRLELAKAQGVPPYVIFHDSTLAEMARHRPSGLNAFAQLPGVGQSKMARYADTFLEVINAHIPVEAG